MAGRPILFSAPMVRALLACTKTQTRRVVKLKAWHTIEERDDGQHWPWMYDGERDADYWLPCPYGQAGDRLWVRETWKVDLNHRFYRADGDPGGSIPWTPSIHMPRWASRITLDVTGVRVERLQEISRGDAMAEGCPFANMAAGPDPRDWYRDLWNEINGTGAWDANPWVWVVEFKRVTP